MNTIISVNASNFDSEVLNSPEPVLVDFWAPWCGPCLRLSAELDAVAEELGGKVKFVKVNVDTDSSLAQKFDVLGIPNMVLFVNGQPVDRLVGLTLRHTISSTLRRHLAA